jgi:hypothetical protein
VLATFDRAELEGFIAVAIDLLDLADPDPDIEPNGDEMDGSLAEDDFTSHNAGPLPGPGCPISDPDLSVDDKPCDEPFEDREPDEPLVPVFGVDQSAGPVDYKGLADADRRMMKPHVDRIRRESCDPIATSFWGAREWRLRDSRDPVSGRSPTL